MFRPVAGIVFISLIALLPVQAGQMPIGVFNLLKVGMWEAKVLVRAGRPDVDADIGLATLEHEALILDPQD